MKIEDGRGRGYIAEVNSQNELKTKSLIVEESVSATFDGDAYNLSTGNITLTSANASGVLYMKNTGSNPIVVTSAIYLLGTSTGGSGNMYAKIYKNPTTGTLISAGTDIVAVNRNFGSANLLDATTKKGAEGSTVTDGTVAIESIFTSSGRQVIALGAIVVNAGNSIAITFQPPTGNTSMITQWVFSCYEKTT